jgi:uncharacterized protein YdcH (DUF465 family)
MNSRFFFWALVPIFLLIRWQGKYITDSIELARYTPPKAVAELAQQTKMNDNGRRTFYLNKPTIEAKKVGLNFCKKNGAEKTVILGCYVSNKGIFIQEVTDPRLAGVMQVTAAHEMLHAVYHQLSESEKTQLNKELHQVYDNLQNTRIKKLLEIYKNQDPTVVDSELHSILGTEVSTLSPALEKHYANYFADRATVVAYAQKYEQTFAQIIDKADALDKQLKAMKTSMESKKSAVENESSSIEQQRTQLDQIRSSGNVDEYNSRLSSFNQKVNSYNQQVQVLKEEIANYNKLVSSYNDLSSEEKSLNDSLRNGSN